MANKTLSEVIAAKRDNLNDHPTTTLAAQIQRVAPQSVSFAVASPSAAIIGRHIFTQHVRLTKVRARLDDAPHIRLLHHCSRFHTTSPLHAVTE